MREAVDASWLAALRAGADQPPLRPRVPLRAGSAVIGSVEPGFLRPVAALQARHGGLLLHDSGADGWVLQGDPTAGLALLANAMREAGLAHAWRNEQLAVTDAHGQVVATVERAVVRGLGVRTRAVHLVGLAPDGRVWLQQRSFTKANDPGLWDTLMGGMIAAADSLATALARETWEEAGLVLEQLAEVAWGGRISIRRPSTDGGGAGYVVEDIDWFRCVVPHGMTPINQDGEVEGFKLEAREGIAMRLADGAFTPEAALILCDAL
ncbi:MAG: NUDIX domain-containing protein [Comamonadaceae bacterium]|nr:MAG: NUDIX domain-containing protein [Comamonadaceae bacterium]